MGSFFVTNLPNSKSDTQVQSILQTEIPECLILTWKGKRRRLGHMTVPSSLISKSPTLQNALENDEGTPLNLPPLPTIYLRPYHPKPKSKSQVPSNGNSKYTQPPKANPASNPSRDVDQRLTQLETTNQTLQAQIQTLSTQVHELQKAALEATNTLTSAISKLTTKLDSISTLPTQITQIQSEMKSLSKSQVTLCQSHNSVVSYINHPNYQHLRAQATPFTPSNPNTNFKRPIQPSPPNKCPRTTDHDHPEHMPAG